MKKPAGFYVGYNEVRRTSGSKTIDELAAAVTSAAAADPVRPIVIDLRNNGGGDNNTYGPLRRAVEAAAHAKPGSVRLITGRATFSAAGNFVTDLLVGPEKAGIRLIGEPPGGGLDIYGDVRVVTLPASKIVVLISARYHERAPGDPRLAIRRTSRSRSAGPTMPPAATRSSRRRSSPKTGRSHRSPGCPAGDTGDGGGDMRIVVTGGSGKGGSWVVRDLREHGHEVVNVDVRPDGAADREDAGRRT